jgi:uncharacterized protein (TIGR03066 family)
MRMLGCVLVLGAGLVLAGCGGGNQTPKAGPGKGTPGGGKTPAGPVDDPETKIVGTWKMAKADPDTATVAVGSEVEFAMGGKYRVLGAKGGKWATEGTYKVEGNKAEGYKLVTTIQVGPGRNIMSFTLLKLTDADLIRRTPAGDVEELTKVK